MLYKTFIREVDEAKRLDDIIWNQWR